MEWFWPDIHLFFSILGIMYLFKPPLSMTTIGTLWSKLFNDNYVQIYKNRCHAHLLLIAHFLAVSHLYTGYFLLMLSRVLYLPCVFNVTGTWVSDEWNLFLLHVFDISQVLCLFVFFVKVRTLITCTLCVKSSKTRYLPLSKSRNCLWIVCLHLCVLAETIQIIDSFCTSKHH